MAADRREIATIHDTATALSFDRDQIDLIRNRYFVEGASDAELQLFLTVAQHRGLDPTKKHIYAVQRWDSSKRANVIAYQVSIDGLRLIAERTGKYLGQTAAYFCGTDGVWKDVWLEDDPPAAAKVGVYKAGFNEPTWGVARWKAYVQTKKDGSPTQFWQKMPDIMLAKCAEALALRKAFPEDTGGLYTTEEMGQADNPTLEVEGRSVSRDTGEINTFRQPGSEPDKWGPGTGGGPIDQGDVPPLRRDAPVSTHDRPQATKPDVEVVEPTQVYAPQGQPVEVGTWDEENRRLMAIANDHDIDRPTIKAWVLGAYLHKGKPITSTKDATPHVLRKAADAIEANAESFKQTAANALSNPDVYDFVFPEADRQAQAAGELTDEEE